MTKAEAVRKLKSEGYKPSDGCFRNGNKTAKIIKIGNSYGVRYIR